jgi:SAM-dependent methyltransferase
LTLIGYVTAKRKLSKNLIFLDFLDATYQRPAIEDDDTIDDMCQALLKREEYTGILYEIYQKCLHKGTKLKVSGIATPTNNPGNVVLSIQSIELLTVPRQPQHIETILRQVMIVNAASLKDDNKGEYRTFLKQVSNACQMKTAQNLLDVLCPQRFVATDDDISSQKLRDVSKSILQNLNEDVLYPTTLVDGKEFAKRRSSNFVVPTAPVQWSEVPSILLEARVVQSFASTPSKSVSSDSNTLQHGIIGFQHLPTTVDGWIQNRRRFENNITVLVIDDCDRQDTGYRNLTSSSDGCGTSSRLECVLHPDFLVDRKDAHPYRNAAAVGCKVSLSGILINRQSTNGETKANTAVLWIKRIRLIRMSFRPAAIYQLLELAKTGAIDLDEAAAALNLSSPEIIQMSTVSSTERKWKANQLSVLLQQQKRQRRVSTLPFDHLSKEYATVLQKYSYVLEDFPAVSTNTFRNTISDVEMSNTAAHGAVPLAQRTSMPGSRYETKKRPQVEWMSAQIQKVLYSHPDYGTRKLSILDIGGGKGLLAHFLGEVLQNVEIHVVDIAAGAIANGIKKSKRRLSRISNPPLSMVNFLQADASSSDLISIDADVVVALHACGHLTDIALAHAIRRRAGFVIAPCCFNSNSHLTIPSFENEHESQVHDWLDIPEIDLSLLKTLAEVQGDIETAGLAMKVLNGLRAHAASRKLENARSGSKNGNPAVRVEILSFPIEYSTRNTVLVGKRWIQ